MCRCWASSQVSNAVAPRSAIPSSRSAPRPGRATASRQDPRVTTRTSATAVPASCSTTGSPSTEPPSPSARRISDRLQRSARTGSSASPNSSAAAWLRVGGRSLSIRYASSPQLFRLRNRYTSSAPLLMQGRPRSWMVRLTVTRMAVLAGERRAALRAAFPPRSHGAPSSRRVARQFRQRRGPALAGRLRRRLTGSLRAAGEALPSSPLRRCQTGRVPPVLTITDPADPRLADFTGLTDVRLRRSLEAEHGLFIAEGEKVIRRAMAAGYPVRSLLVPQDRQAALAD